MAVVTRVWFSGGEHAHTTDIACSLWCNVWWAFLAQLPLSCLMRFVVVCANCCSCPNLELTEKGFHPQHITMYWGDLLLLYLWVFYEFVTCDADNCCDELSATVIKTTAVESFWWPMEGTMMSFTGMEFLWILHWETFNKYRSASAAKNYVWLVSQSMVYSQKQT